MKQEMKDKRPRSKGYWKYCKYSGGHYYQRDCGYWCCVVENYRDADDYCSRFKELK